MLTLTAKDLKWMGFCLKGAEIFSTCGKRKYFAIVLAPNGRVVGTGFNGSPPGVGHCVDGYCPRLAENSASGSSYHNCIAVHAESNALMWSDRTAREGGTLYVNGPCCWDCGKLIASSGVRRLVHLEDPSYADWPRVCELLEQAGVTVLGLEADQL